MIRKVVRGRKTRDGAGVKLTRVLSHDTVYDFDPFLMLDVFDSVVPEDYIRGFPNHPHRGIETITYLLKGEIRHKDSLGNSGIIKALESQWVTAGSGILHEEMPQVVPHMLGIQLWLNLPSKHKMTTPKYTSIGTEDITTIKEDGNTIRLISGTYRDNQAKFSGDFIKVQFLDVELEPKQSFELDMNPENNSFIYIISGNLKFERGIIPEKSAILLTGKKLIATSCNEGARFLFFSAKPLKETIAWGGPIVMNTDAELNRAFEEIENGTFIKHKI